ncbi:MAG: DUF3618 domain-containing protein [Actinomycetota bacterium]|nr:DUF3618 domain-containing protein [Actinomycetota bacterium]
MSTPEDIQADIEQQREQLAETVDALQAKLDVKSQAKAKVARLQDKATTAEGAPRPEVIAGGVAVAAMFLLLILRRARRRLR